MKKVLMIILSFLTIVGYGQLLAPRGVNIITTRTYKTKPFYIVNSTTNKNVSTITQSLDSSALGFQYTYTGSPLFTVTDKNGQILFRVDSIGFGIGTATPLTKLSARMNVLTNLNGFNFVNNDINKRRDSYSQAIDTSSFTLSSTATGSLTLSMTSKTGTNIIKADSSNVTFGVPFKVYIGDTTITASKSVVVFKTSDSTYYGCRSTTANKKWYSMMH